MVPTLDGKMTPACEIMLNTPIVRKLIEENRLDKLSVAVETGHDDGMQDFNKAVLELYNAGRISKEEAMLKAGNPGRARNESQGHLPHARQPHSRVARPRAMKRLLTSLNSAEMGLARSVLEAAQIPCELRNESVAQAFQIAPFASELWVNDEDFDEATHLLAGSDDDGQAAQGRDPRT